MPNTGEGTVVMKRRILTAIFAVVLIFGLIVCRDMLIRASQNAGEDVPAASAQEQTADPAQPEQPETPPGEGEKGAETALAEDGSYDSKEDVALYLHTYGRLPANYITKDEARALGWEGGGLEKYAPGKCIGGDRFGNYEKLLPEGRRYRECDIGTLGQSSRGAQRLIYSDDGLIYYTGDHYESFELLYGEADG